MADVLSIGGVLAAVAVIMTAFGQLLDVVGRFFGV
jgi:hypothetical protein